MCLKKVEEDGRRAGLQRLFSTFPAGWPGLGLLLLRAAVGLTLVIQGAASLNDWRSLRFDTSVALLITSASGLCLLVGALTPIASVLVALIKIGFALSWFSLPNANPLDGQLSLIYLIAMTTAIALLGPGAFSLDARSFGRREIIIPNPRRGPRP